MIFSKIDEIEEGQKMENWVGETLGLEASDTRASKVLTHRRGFFKVFQIVLRML